jgi:hypothetical protein
VVLEETEIKMQYLALPIQAAGVEALATEELVELVVQVSSSLATQTHS